MANFLHFCLVLLLSREFAVECFSENERFADFLTENMNDYPAWAQLQGFEPTPLIEDILNLTQNIGLVNMTGEIRNQVFNGLSNIESENIYISANLGQKVFNIYWTTSGVTVSGEYDITGTVYSKFPIIGSGNFSISAGSLYAGIWVHNFRVTEDGYIDISGADVAVNTCQWNEWTPTFDGLSASGYEDTIIELIRQRYRRQTNWFPVKNYVRLYLKKVFADYSLQEILADTTPETVESQETSEWTPSQDYSETTEFREDTTTSEYTSESTDIWESSSNWPWPDTSEPTSQDPHFSSQASTNTPPATTFFPPTVTPTLQPCSVDNSTIVHGEKILGSNITRGDDGGTVIYIKKLVEMTVKITFPGF